MTVGELITMLQDIPDQTLPVFVEDDYVREGFSEAAEVVTIGAHWSGAHVKIVGSGH